MSDPISISNKDTITLEPQPPVTTWVMITLEGHVLLADDGRKFDTGIRMQLPFQGDLVNHLLVAMARELVRLRGILRDVPLRYVPEGWDKA